MAASTTAPDVANDAVTRKPKQRQRLAPLTQTATPDVATVASPVSAIERLDNLIKVIATFESESLENCKTCCLLTRCSDTVAWLIRRSILAH